MTTSSPDPRRARRRAGIVALIAILAVAAAVAVWAALRNPVPPTASPTQTAPTSSPAPTSAEPSPEPTDQDPLAGWTLEQKVGQLFVVGLDLTTPEQVSRDLVTERHVGNVFLHGRSSAGVDAISAVVDDFASLATPEATNGAPMLIAADQEGGTVQTLSGPGFSTIPSALEQASVDPAELQAQAAGWGDELAAAGVNLNLAPVLDLVPEESAASNPPIGALARNYGFTADSVSSHGTAFARGMAAAGVATAAKHFPGLGFVTQNTDGTAGVTDATTTWDSPSIGVFADGVEAGVQLVMMSTAIYTQMDPGAPAAFSSEVVQHGVRELLGFDGPIITDDLSGATQVEAWSPGDRAILAIEAGCDLVLFSKVPSVAPEAVDAVVAKAQSDAAFAARIDESVRRVIALKESMGLLD